MCSSDLPFIKLAVCGIVSRISDGGLSIGTGGNHELQAALNVKIRPSSYTYFSIATMLVKLFFREFCDIKRNSFHESRPCYFPKTEQNLLTL